MTPLLLLLDLSVPNRRLYINESIYRSVVQITIPKPLDLARTPSLCSVKSTDKHTEMICKIQPHPLTKSEHGLLDLKLDVSRLKPGVGRVVLKFNASSDGHESRPGKNILMYHLQLKTEADIAVKGLVLGFLGCSDSRFEGF